MSVMLNLKRKFVVGLVLTGAVAISHGAGSLGKIGNEYPILPGLPRDQVLPHLSLGPAGGYIVSQDPTIDGNGLGIRARRINVDLSAGTATFAVNSITAGEQQNAKVAVFPNGGAAFAWQGSAARGNRIYVRFMTAAEVFTGPEVLASTRASGHQSDPAIAVLKDGAVVVVWAEWNRDGSMQGIYGQRFNSNGGRLGVTFQLNTVTYLNQRTPVIAALENGGFVAAWVSDEFRLKGSEHIDVAARLFDSNANPLGADFALNSGDDICANPSLVATATGFRAAWSSRRLTVPQFVRKDIQGSKEVDGVIIVDEVTMALPAGPSSPDSWDVTTRLFDLGGSPAGSEVVVNNTRKGDQFSPRLANFGEHELVLWTSFGQDRSDEGIYGRVVTGPDNFGGSEFLVNTRIQFKQIFPTVSTLGDKVLVAWSSFMSAAAGFDIRAQQYSVSPDETLPKPAAPFAFATGPDTISVTWAEVGGQEVEAYRIYIDEETTPLLSTGGMMNIQRPQWVAGSSHAVRLSYKLKDGRVSPSSDTVTILTWGADENADSLPDEWQRENWGKQANWPLASADTDGDGANNLAEFLAGTDPTSVASVLKVEISAREQGVYLQWPTAAGSYYQLQVTSDFKNWTNVGAARFAPSTLDAVPAEGAGQIQYYRVIRMR